MNSGYRSRTSAETAPFQLADDGAFLSALNTAICSALQVQDLFEALPRFNHHERVFICLDVFFTEAEANGVSHFFYYNCGGLHQDVLSGLEEIGAPDIKVKLEQYIARVFRGPVPSDMSTRQEVLEATGDEADDAEWLVGDHVSVGVKLLATWARANREHFRLNAAG